MAETVFTTGPVNSSGQINIGSGANSNTAGQIAFPSTSTHFNLSSMTSAADGTGTIVSVDGSGLIKKAGGTHNTVAKIDTALAGVASGTVNNFTPSYAIVTGNYTTSNIFASYGTYWQLNGYTFGTAVLCLAAPSSVTGSQFTQISLNTPTAPSGGTFSSSVLCPGVACACDTRSPPQNVVQGISIQSWASNAAILIGLSVNVVSNNNTMWLNVNFMYH